MGQSTKAAERAGANACYLSGAGPSVLAITSGASGDIFAQREKVSQLVIQVVHYLLSYLVS